MIITEHINRDHQDIYNLLNIISTSETTANTSSVTKSMPLLYEIKDIIYMYWNLRQEIIFNKVKLSPDQEYHYLNLLENYTQSYLLLNRCLKTLLRNDVKTTIIQIKLLKKMIKQYLDDEMNYLKMILPEYFSDNELHHMGKHYELSKIYPLQASQSIIH